MRVPTLESRASCAWFWRQWADWVLGKDLRDGIGKSDAALHAVGPTAMWPLPWEDSPSVETMVGTVEERALAGYFLALAFTDRAREEHA